MREQAGMEESEGEGEERRSGEEDCDAGERRKRQGTRESDRLEAVGTRELQEGNLGG